MKTQSRLTDETSAAAIRRPIEVEAEHLGCPKARAASLNGRLVK
jgi:hypothetical protein